MLYATATRTCYRAAWHALVALLRRQFLFVGNELEAICMRGDPGCIATDG